MKYLGKYWAEEEGEMNMEKESVCQVYIKYVYITYALNYANQILLYLIT